MMGDVRSACGGIAFLAPPAAGPPPVSSFPTTATSASAASSLIHPHLLPSSSPRLGLGLGLQRPPPAARRRPLHAAVAAVPASGAGAWASLLGSATLGLALERRTRAGKAVGASLLAFLLQAVAANMGLAPTECAAYDACWGTMLPASLSLSVLLAVDAASSSTVNHRWAASSFAKVSVAYVVGALGSLAGAVLAFHVTAALFPPSSASGLAPAVLARVAAAVAATYVGGSVNFFQVARAVGLDKGECGQGLLGSVAGADIVLMGLYFAALVGMQRSQHRGMAAFIRARGPTVADSCTSRISTTRSFDLPGSSSSSSNGAGGAILLKTMQHLAAFCIAAALGQAGQRVEQRLALPGAAAAATTVLSLAAYAACRRATPGLFQAMTRRAPSLSAFLFALFFAAIGAGASLPHLLLSGPCVLLLMGLALSVHVGTTALALRVYNAAAVARGAQERVVGVDEMVVASNANIGGPATAAAMAAAIGRPDLVLSATATGTLGYSAATWLGVALFGVLNAAAS